MSSISIVVPAFAKLELFKKSAPTAADVKAWVANQNYFIDSPITAAAFTLRPSSKSSLASAYANDCNRMAIAAIETVAGIRKDDVFPKSGAWGMVRAYYASFFAAHAILRIFGISCSQLGKDHMKKILEIAKMLGNDNGITILDGGFHSITIGSNFDTVSFFRYSNSHKETWECFLKLLKDLRANVSTANILHTRKAEVIDILDKITKGLTRNGCSKFGDWLSSMRNSVNYQHSHGVWYPYQTKSQAAKYIEGMNKNWLHRSTDFCPAGKDSEVEDFFEVSMLIVSVMRELILACSGSVEEVSASFSNGCLKLLRSLRADKIAG